jgi:hypothetical protein
LAGEADAIVTYGATLDMFGTGTLTTGPAICATIFTVGLAARWTVDDATISTDDFLASATLANTIIAADMPITIQRDYFSLAVTGMASWALDAARVTVARDVDNGLSLAIAEIDLG